MKKLSAPLILLVLVLGGVFALKAMNDEDTWRCVGYEWVKHGNPDSPKPDRPCGTFDITRADLLNFYKQSEELNKNKDGVSPVDFPKVLGTLQERTILQTFECAGDVCPQNSSVEIEYKEVDENNCPGTGGTPIYGYGWGRQYMGCSPLFVKDGNLTGEAGSWSITYEEPGKPALKTDLIFESDSICNENFDCSSLKTGDRIKVYGRMDSDKLKVWSLRSI